MARRQLPTKKVKIESLMTTKAKQKMHFPFFVHKLKKRPKLKYVSSLIKSFEPSVHNLTWRKWISSCTKKTPQEVPNRGEIQTTINGV